MAIWSDWQLVVAGAPVRPGSGWWCAVRFAKWACASRGEAWLWVCVSRGEAAWLCGDVRGGADPRSATCGPPLGAVQLRGWRAQQPGSLQPASSTPRLVETFAGTAEKRVAVSPTTVEEEAAAEEEESSEEELTGAGRVVNEKYRSPLAISIRRRAGRTAASRCSSTLRLKSADVSYAWQTNMCEPMHAAERPPRPSLWTTVLITSLWMCRPTWNHAKEAGSNQSGVLNTRALSTSTRCGQRRCIRCAHSCSPRSFKPAASSPPVV
mmetsp:Transcript_5477/g.16125  ORF Transcript_5477/g.16125 Transcript_5477/m.16125 type:complete len:266 (-) Transcript_5477:39-836(-)|eukprot:818867-Prymnesium_polylepis.1